MPDTDIRLSLSLSLYSQMDAGPGMVARTADYGGFGAVGDMKVVVESGTTGVVEEADAALATAEGADAASYYAAMGAGAAEEEATADNFFGADSDEEEDEFEDV